MPCPNCGGNYAHESAVGDTRTCNCTSSAWTTFTTGAPITIQMPNEKVTSIHIDSLPGGTGYAMGVAAERKEAARKLLAEVKRLSGIDERSGYYEAHAQGLYNYVRKEYADIISKTHSL